MVIALRDEPLHATHDDESTILLLDQNEGVLSTPVGSDFVFNSNFNFNIYSY